jgi:small-conductance mechanosensitive channel
VIQALREVAEESPHVLKNPEPDVLLSGFGDSSWNMELRVWLQDPKNYYPIRSEINCAIVHKFRQYGIEIPYPQRDLHVRSPLPIPLLTKDNL